MANLNPAITFQLNLTPDLITLLHPDKYQNNQDLGQAQAAYRTALINSWFPGLMNGENIEQKSAYTFTAYGSKAHYILQTYAVARPSQPPVVSVIAWEYSDGTSIPVGTSVPVNDGQFTVGNVVVQAAQPVVPA
jgi:hypothetical protein